MNDWVWFLSWDLTAAEISQLSNYFVPQGHTSVVVSFATAPLTRRQAPAMPQYDQYSNKLGNCRSQNDLAKTIKSFLLKK